MHRMEAGCIELFARRLRDGDFAAPDKLWLYGLMFCSVLLHALWLLQPEGGAGSFEIQSRKPENATRVEMSVMFLLSASLDSFPSLSRIELVSDMARGA